MIRKIIQVGPICNLYLYKLGTEGGLAQKRRQLMTETEFRRMYLKMEEWPQAKEYRQLSGG